MDLTTDDLERRFGNICPIARQLRKRMNPKTDIWVGQLWDIDGNGMRIVLLTGDFALLSGNCGRELRIRQEELRHKYQEITEDTTPFVARIKASLPLEPEE